MDSGRGGNEVAGKLVRLVASAGPKNPFSVAQITNRISIDI